MVCVYAMNLRLDFYLTIRSFILTAKASWYSNTSMSSMVKPDFSSTLGVAKAGLKTNI